MIDSTDEVAPSVGAHRVLYVSLRKWRVVLAIGFGFVAIGIAMIVLKGDFLAWFVTSFFALVTGVALLQIKGFGSQLELNADTFVVRNFGRVTTERWDECADFTVYRVSRNEQVVYDRARDIDTHVGAMNRSISGRTAGLPDTFSMTADELAELMMAYRENAVERSWQVHARAVEEFASTIGDGFRQAGVDADVITDRALMELPDGIDAWPDVLAVARDPRSDGSKHVLICADVLSPDSRWITEDAKRDQAFDILGADELQIIDPDNKDVRRLVQYGGPAG